MGNGASQSRREKDIRLVGTGLRFTSQQLTALSNHFSDQLDSASGELKCDPDRSSAEALIERLIQRLICGVGTLDHRFSSKFLITLDPTKSATEPGLSFSYLVRLDCLSQPALYPDQWDQPTCHIVEGDGGPQGFSKIRIQGEGAEKWAEFVNNNGYLRRDKVQERFVELLAQSAARTSVPGRPDHIDESRLCGSPGKVVDAGIADYIVHTPPEEQMYFGAAECNRNRFPDPREYRIAIVEGTPCVRLRIGLLPSLCLSTLEEDVQVTMTLGIGFVGWPQTCDFPARIPLCHADALLYQQAAATGFYLVPAPPHPTVRCDDRTAAWQFRFPAAELALLTHYSPQSLPSRVLATLRLIVSDLRRTTNGGHVVSDYMLKTILWFRLEEDKDTVMDTLKEWDHEQLALHVLVMGNGASQSRREKDIRLVGTGLRFTSQQLTALSNHFSDQLDSASGELKCDPDRSSAEALIERLIQRLICGVGTLDHRFSSKFLITLDPTKSATEPGLSFSYLVRLDCLSQPALYPDQWDQPTCHIVEGDGGPQGFSKIRIQGEGAEKWAEFVNNNGYLRRDKVQERFVELLAQSAARTSVPGRPDHIDESRLCGSPGKVVDAGIADYIVHTPPEEQMYFGAAECNRNRFPDPREYRIAIVEGTPCVRLRIGLLPSLCLSTLEEDVQVTMTLGIGFVGWPQTCDFPARIPLCHADALLYQQAAATGFYLVPAPPHPTVRCDDRTAAWQFRFPAAELGLLTHYSSQSLPSRVLATLRLIVSDLRRTTNGGHVVSDYMLKTILWFRLEEDKDTVMDTLKEWDHEQLALHVLMILDTLIASLRTQRYRSYFFPWFNIMLNSPGGGTLHYTEEDYTHDAQILESFLFRLNQMTPHLPSSASHDHDSWRKMESKLIHKWSDVLNDLSPPTATRSRRLSGNSYSTAVASQYTNRQLEYIGHILRGMLQVRSLTMSQCPYVEATWLIQNNNNNNNNVNSVPAQSALCDTESSEDLIFLLKAILEQARNLALLLKDKSKRSRTPNNRSNNRYSNVNRKYNRNNSAGSSRSNVFDSFDASVCSLVEEIRKDRAVADLSDDNVLVRQVLKWLYYGVDKDRRILSPVLRPYLNKLFTVSHENCWHLDEWTKRRENEEIKALKKFCSLVVKEGLSPSDGIVDAVQKGWNWAENIIEMAGQMDDGVELIFTPRMGKVMRYRVRLSKQSGKNTNRDRTAYNSLGRNSLTLESYRKCAVYTAATMPRHNSTVRDFLSARLNGEPYNLFDSEPVMSPHSRLRATSPMVIAFDTQRRYGAHRGLGSIVNALIVLKKFSVLQEVSTLLPEDQRGQVLDDIQRVSKERRRARKTVGGTVAGGSGMLINRKYNNLSDKRRRGAEKKYHSDKTLATYRPTDEFYYNCGGVGVGVQSSSSEADVSDALKHIKLTDTLLGTCREARSRQNLNAVYNPVFFERPPAQWFHQDTTNTLNPLSQPMLRLTSDNSLAFQPVTDFVTEMTSSSSFNNMASSLAKKINGKKKEVVTKL